MILNSGGDFMPIYLSLEEVATIIHSDMETANQEDLYMIVAMKRCMSLEAQLKSKK